jgi:glucosyl-3-phosphoglycerate synthase
MEATAASWFASRTSSWRDWPLERLLTAKDRTRVSVVLPALDEEATVGAIVTGVRRLAERTRLVDEVIVVDSGSQDATAKVAYEAGAIVYHRDDILPAHGSNPGKGDVLWKSLAVATGDILVYVDADLTDFQPHFVYGLLGPLLTDPDVAMVKAFYDRPLLDVSAQGGGDWSGPARRSLAGPDRSGVTELMARPLLNAYFPELAGVVQPLAGEYAARRSLLETLPFAAGCGVETGLLLDTVLAAGLDAVAQVDLGERTHGHQDTAALGRMAAAILHTVLARVHPNDPLGDTLTQFARAHGRITAVDTPVAAPPRPPMNTIPEYRSRRV